MSCWSTGTRHQKPDLPESFHTVVNLQIGLFLSDCENSRHGGKGPASGSESTGHGAGGGGLAEDHFMNLAMTIIPENR